ncbi:MAG TPA: type I-U CRISPR-associated helicase/endonuclease Cas3 [Alphaproteobacteria bacterium]|nr:type I-U CRISPR-associated helicase/endonuclease Cas3 [Alphaproteobacteria bacterium]
MLTADDFGDFFEEVHGYAPFPWQKRLLAEIVGKREGKWPSTLDLPTGSGKTAAIDIAVFHLALEADRIMERRAPVRMAFVVDRRLVVDDAFGRAQKLEAALAAPPPGSVSARVAERLRILSGDGPPLIARRLRGGIPREDDWARTPSQPTVLCSTVDQIGSRLLFRGYGISDSMKPVHAGLIGSDCLILLDEAHLAEPFRQTMEWADLYRGPNWREAKVAAPWGFSLLTATPGEHAGEAFSLDDEDRSHPILKRRLQAEKLARLVSPAKATGETDGSTGIDDEDEESGSDAKTLARRCSAIVDEIRKALGHFDDAGHGAPRPAIGVVVNRVARAREVFNRLSERFAGASGNDSSAPALVLMIGPARPVDRDDLVESLQPIRTRLWAAGENRELDRPLILVATQCIEAGVDIDLDALITEAAPIDSLRQRFGRLNRGGREIEPYAAIIADKSDISARADDPVYGKAIKPAWDYLVSVATRANGALSVDFGIEQMNRLAAPGRTAFSDKPDAPVLLPAHLDLLSQTSPIPAADPEVGLYLHGPDRQPDSITVVWRADIDPSWRDQDVTRLLTLVPPRAGEAVELPLWAVRRWLEGRRKSAGDMADVPTRGVGDEATGGKRVFRWKGNDEGSQWIDPAMLRPGDTIVVPANYGGVDAFGWNPDCEATASDVALKAAEAFATRRFSVRIAPGLLEGRVSDEALATALAALRAERAQTVRQALLDLDLPADIRQALEWLDAAKRRHIVVDFTLYGENRNGEPRGVVLVAPLGVKGSKAEGVIDRGEDGRPNSTEDDTAGSIFDFPVSLVEHRRDVERKAEEFAERAGLPASQVADLKRAGYLHDQGKRDPRFQAWLHFGDPLGFDPDDETDVLAKSGRTLPPAARERSGLPDHWRHEALSVRLARTDARFAEANDRDLVLWLVGTHHGYGRPLYPHHDPTETPPDIGPQSLAFAWDGLDWPSLFARLKARYGVWELARMEAILRLADHRASQEARERIAKEGDE